MDDLNGKTFYIGAAGIAGHRWSFKRSTDDTTDYSGAAIALRLFEQSGKGIPISTSPALSLSLGNGLTRQTNTATEQAGILTITDTQAITLLGAATAKRYGYVWVVTPTGGSPLRAASGQGYDGFFIIASEAYAGGAVVKVP